MTRLRLRILFAAALSIVCAAMPFAPGAYGAECRRKTAGFYLEEAAGPRNLAFSLKSLPASLTGLPGNAGRGREVLVSRQRGGCLNCHKVGALSSIPGQGGIGPALDGAGSKYNDSQLRQVLVEPKAYFPETVMPAYYRSATAASVLTAAEIEDLIAYLKTLK